MFKSLRSFYLALVALIGLCGAVAVGNYTMTQGSGTSFGSVVVGGTVHYAQQLICDLVTPSQCASVSAAGAVKVDGSAVTQPVSGTVTSNVGTGTRPVSIASGQVASGAYASGSIGAGAQVDLLTMRQTVAGGTVASNSILAGGTYNSSPITMTNGQGAALQFDINGYLKVNTAAGAAAGGTSSNFGSAFPTPGTAIGFTDGTNMVAARVGAVANSTAATNYINSLGVCQYLASAPTITDTRFNQIQCDTNGYLRVTVQNTNTNLTPGDGIATGTYTVGSPTLGASLLWNGTSYDRWKSVSTGVASIGIASGNVASGAFASGSIASGALASGSIASGAMVDLLTMRGTIANGTAASNAMAVGGIYNSSPLTLTNTQGSALQFDANGYLKIRPSDGTSSVKLDPCEANTQSYVNGVITSATTTRLITPSASNKTYICSMLITASAADNVGIVEGTGGTCGTSTAGVVGGTTAANGPNFTANGGLMMQAGGKVAVAQTAGTNVDFCFITSTSGPLTYSIKYVQAP